MPIILSSNNIAVSGVGVPLNGISFPSGLFPIGSPGSNLGALLTSLNSSFGFNLTPHNFQLEFIPFGNAVDFHGASGQLPAISSPFELFIGDFLVRGRITHADYTSSVQGTVVNIVVEDDRHSLRKVKIHTEDIGEDVPSGVVSIARAYRRLNGLDNDATIKEYQRILEFGATYNQFLAAIDLEYNENRCAIPVTDLPSVSAIELNLGGSSESIRWQFNLSTLDEAITRILQDVGFDWYWNMDAAKINLINKKVSFEFSESQILDLVNQFGAVSGLDQTKQIGFGEDLVPDPTRFRVLGGHQEGFINSHILSPIDGLDTSALDNKVIFNKIWDRLTIGFYDANGFYRTYIPTEKELQLALAGIEQWSYYKIYQSTSPSHPTTPGYGYPPDDGSIAAQDVTFQSRIDPLMPLAGGATGESLSGLRVISNRRDEEHNWVLEFYNRIKNHASRHYGRSYVVEGLLFNSASGLYRLVDAAWCNVENQVQGYTLSSSGTITNSGIFTSDYQINKALGPISPFLTDDFRVKAYCVLPADTKYGPQGDDVPASFSNWTEDSPPFNPTGDGRHYIPIDLVIVGQRVIDPRSDDLYSFESFPEGTLLCQLPINAGPGSGLIEDGTLSNLATLLTTRNKLNASGTRDILNPAIVLNAYMSLSGVAIPVEARSRYGQTYPSQWVDGTLHFQNHEEVQLDDQFVPWAFSPMGSQTSLDIMTEKAFRRVQGKIVPKIFSRYGDFTQVGLPLLSYDAFANQNIGPSGYYGEISHGVNELNINFGEDGFSTRYKIQSFYPKFGIEAPLGERSRGLLDGIIHPIDYTNLNLLNNVPPNPGNPILPGDDFPIPIFTDNEKRAVRATITEVNNVFDLSTPGVAQEERYFGVDRQLYTKPPKFSSSDPDFTEGAICIDGFLNIGDSAIYHNDEFELPGSRIVFRYFSQGRKFGNGTIVQVERTNGNNYDVTIVDPTALARGYRRAVINVPLLNGSINVGDKTTLAVQGDGPVKPGNSVVGLYLNPTASDSAGVKPYEIIAVSGQGTISALAVCKPLDVNGVVIMSGITVGSVIPIPYRQFATSGDRGFLSQVLVTDQTTGGTSRANFIQIAKPSFVRF